MLIGEGSIDRNTQRCHSLTTKNLGGIKSLHQLNDVGIPGQLCVRQCSCHSCDRCKSGRYNECVNIDLLGPAETITLRPDGGRSVRLTRNALSELGISLASQVSLCLIVQFPASTRTHTHAHACTHTQVTCKEIIGVELSGENESFMLAEVLSMSGPREVETEFDSYFGHFERGDKVLNVRKLEPLSLGSSLYQRTEKEFPIFIEDVRKRNMQQHLQPVDLSRRSSRVAPSSAAGPSVDVASAPCILALSPEGKSLLLKLTCADSRVGDRRELRRMANN